MYKTLELNRHGRVLAVRFMDTPYSLMTSKLVDDLEHVINEADRDESIGAVVFTGSKPGVFLAHYDVSELLKSSKGAPKISEKLAAGAVRLVEKLSKNGILRDKLKRSPLVGVFKLNRMQNLLVKMGQSGTVFIAAINGSTAGGGLELSMACDFRFISEDGELAQPEILLGFPPGSGGTQRLTRLLGEAKAIELMLTARAVSAIEAKQLGLVTDVFPIQSLMSQVELFAEKMATRYKPAVSVIKRCVRSGGSLSLSEGLIQEQAGFLSLLGSEGAQKGMTKYVETTQIQGKLPALDPDLKRSLLSGEFIKFYGEPDK